MGKYNKKDRHFEISEFQHPKDKAAVEAVLAVPGCAKLLKYLAENSVERVYEFMNNSSRMKVTREMSPVIFAMLDEAAEMYGVPSLPNVYLKRAYEYEVTLEGINTHNIIFTTSMLEHMDEKRLWPVITSEFAGIQAKHGVIRFLDLTIRNFKDVLPFVVDQAMVLALNSWYRNKAYTYDRAILLALEDFRLAAECILLGEVPDEVLGTIELDQPDNPYLEQAMEFLERSGAAGAYQKLTTMLTKEQWMASRYVELYNWYRSGEYDEILEDREV